MLLKIAVHMSTRLRMSEAGIDVIDTLSFLLRLSKHEILFLQSIEFASGL
jgi:hypothetical protein